MRTNFDGDKLPDLLTSLGHDYGIFWMEQQRSDSGERTWTKHMIDNGWSQAHALSLADLTGDGNLKSLPASATWLTTGEREPLGVYWYEWLRIGGRLEWKKHIIDYGSQAGGGMQTPVVDIDGDGDLDVVPAGKSGLFLFEQIDPLKE